MAIIKIIPIEGNRLKLDGGAMFGNAPKAIWKKWVEVDKENRIPLSSRALYIETTKKKILLEVGTGAFFEPKLKKRYGIDEKGHMLLKNLKAQGINPEDIDVIILSHLHFDHAGGLLPAYEEGKENIVFPKAKIYVGKRHFEYAKKPSLREKASFIPQLLNLLEKSGQLNLIEGSSHKDLENLSFSFSEGHTKGLLLTHLIYQKKPLVFASDLIPGKAWVHLPITMGYDRFAEKKVEEKKKLLEEMVKKRGKIFLTHDPTCAMVEVKIDERGRFYPEPCPF